MEVRGPAEGGREQKRRQASGTGEWERGSGKWEGDHGGPAEGRRGCKWEGGKGEEGRVD